MAMAAARWKERQLQVVMTDAWRDYRILSLTDRRHVIIKTEIESA